MTMAATSPATEHGAELRLVPSASPTTRHEAPTAPKTAEEASALLERAERLLSSGGANGVLRTLARFLGANSSAWTPSNRARLRRVLASRGVDALEAIVKTLQAHPRTDVLDDAELTLRGLTKEALEAVSPLVGNPALAPSVRACLLRAIVGANTERRERLLSSSLNDAEMELRDAAASLIGELDLVSSKPLLERRLARETDPTVRASIRDALLAFE